MAHVLDVREIEREVVEFLSVSGDLESFNVDAIVDSIRDLYVDGREIASVDDLTEDEFENVLVAGMI